MSVRKIVDTLLEVPLFRNIDPKQLRIFAMMGETLKYRAGERVFEKGDAGDAAFVVLSGEVDVLIPTNGGETSVAVLGPREIFGEMAVLCNQPRSTAIAAKTDVVILRLDEAVIMKMLREFPAIALEFIKVLAGRLETTTRELAKARS